MWKAMVVSVPLLGCAAWGQTAKLTARELFYAAAEVPARAAAASKVPAKAARPGSARNKPAGGTAVAARPEAPPPATGEARPALPGGGQYLPVAAGNAAAERRSIPLGLRYSILKLVDGRMVPVASDSVFRAGDRIQVSVEANDTGYLYIVHQGTSGMWKPLFPSPEVEDGNNRIEKGRAYVMPPKSRFYFDEQAGEEKLFIVLSREPEPDLEKLVYQLQDGKRRTAPEPSSQPTAPRPAPVMLASNLQIEDSVVGRLRTVYARDLVVEKVDGDVQGAAAGGHNEKAVYVVNPSGSRDSRVVADLRLTHR